MSSVQDLYAKAAPMIQALQNFSAYLAENAVAFQTPEFVEERRKKLTESYQIWGKYGWAWIGSAPLTFYFTPPVDMADANKRIKPYCTPSVIDELFAELSLKKVKKSDLNSAIYCYRHRQYKPCALILLGTIDASS